MRVKVSRRQVTGAVALSGRAQVRLSKGAPVLGGLEPSWAVTEVGCEG